MSKIFASIRARLIAGQLLTALVMALVALSFGRFVSLQRAALEELRVEQQGFFVLNRVAGGFTAYQAVTLSKDSTLEQIDQAWKAYEERLALYAPYNAAISERIQAQVQRYAGRAGRVHELASTGADPKELQEATLAARAEVIALGAILKEGFDALDQHYKSLLAEDLAQQENWQRVFRLSIALALVFLLLYGWFLLRAIVRPLTATVAGIRALQSGERGPELPRHGEFGAVAGVLDELRRATARMHDLAYTDSLTQLGSRARFDQALADAVPAAVREQRSCAVALLELPQLELISSAHGPRVADLWLAAAARRLAELLRPEQTLCRVGDARFAFLLPEAAGAGAAARQVRGLFDRLQAPLLVEGLSLRLEVRAGVACSPADGGSAGEILAAAETALAAVRQKRDLNVAVYDKELAQSFRADLALAQDIERGLAQQEFLPYYEPIIDRSEGTVVGVEALARWQHPRRGLLSPGTFVPLAESSGQIAGIDAQIFAAAAAQLRRWQESHPQLQLALNISARDLTVEMIRHLYEVIEANGLRGEQLVAELTETSVMAAAAELEGVISGLHKLGVAICLDDFGTGYSSLSHLMRLPISRLKIDRTFISGIGRTPAAERIIEATLLLAQRLNLSVVAEGVETSQQMRWLLERGCTRQQGWLYSTPQPADKVAAWLAQAPQQLARLREPAQSPAEARP